MNLSAWEFESFVGTLVRSLLKVCIFSGILEVAEKRIKKIKGCTEPLRTPIENKEVLEH
jgi:hypothetical protein